MAAIELAPGSAVGGGRYALERLLGSGGMASVWLARDRRLDRHVAVKLLSDVLALDPSYVKRFQREATIAARLWHPNLVRVYDFDVDAGRPLFVMEFVDGPTLAQLLREARPLDLAPRRIAAELLAALEHIHRAGVVHRDVKPANVLVGEEGRIRLTDFGIAHPTGATRLTMPGGVIGTLGYLAPEVIAGERATPRSDLYSCGVVIAACADNRGERRGPLRGLIAQLTAQDPAARPPSAAAALDLLDVRRRPATATVADRVATDQVARTAVQPPRIRPRPRFVRPRPIERPLRATAAGFAVGIALVAIAALAIALSSGASGRARTTPPRSAAVPPPSAPLAAQLDALDRDVGAAATR